MISKSTGHSAPPLTLLLLGVRPTFFHASLIPPSSLSPCKCLSFLLHGASCSSWPHFLAQFQSSLELIRGVCRTQDIPITLTQSGSLQRSHWEDVYKTTGSLAVVIRISLKHVRKRGKLYVTRRRWGETLSIFIKSLMLKGPQEKLPLKLSNHLQRVKTKVPPATAAHRREGQRFWSRTLISHRLFES